MLNDTINKEDFLDPNKYCRICLENEESKENELIYPCRCIGTCKYVHRKCLTYWRNSNEPNSQQKTHCMICLTPYNIVNIPYKYKYYVNFIIWYSSKYTINTLLIIILNSIINYKFFDLKYEKRNNNNFIEFFIILLYYLIITSFLIFSRNYTKYYNFMFNIFNLTLMYTLFILLIYYNITIIFYLALFITYYFIEICITPILFIINRDREYIENYNEESNDISSF